MITSNKTSKVLAIIPARGGSKRLKDKNILELNGKPLISYTIEAALNSKCIDEIVVTSDSDSILEIANKFNVKTIKRPDYLATDTSETIDTVLHTIEKFAAYDTIILLQATSPLRTAIDIDNAYDEYIKKEAEAVVSVCECEHSPLWSNTLGNDNTMDKFISDEIKNLRSQELQTYYRLNGAIYIINKNTLIKEKTFFISDKIHAYIMNLDSSVDIDSKLDFLYAQTIINYKENK